MTPEPSPAMVLIRHVYEHQGYQMGRSKERFHAGVREAVHLAIMYGLRFDPDDFASLAVQQRPSYGNTSMYLAGECEYALACGVERGRFNPSAALSYEKWRDRKPFLVRDPDEVTPTRVYVGREVVWYGERVSCTSFAEDNTYFIACTYKPQGKNSCERKIDRRLKITHANIRDYHAALKERARIDELSKQLSPEVRERLRGRYKEAFGDRPPSRLTLAELRQAAAWIESEAVPA